jgi:hypothetical protein
LKSIRLVRDHAPQHSLVGGIRHHTRVQFVFSFARLGRENVPGERMMPDNLPRPGFPEPFGRTFMGLEFGHEIFRENRILPQSVHIRSIESVGTQVPGNLAA